MEKKQGLISRAVTEIENNIGDDINIVSVSNAIGCSPWYLQRVFRDTVGDTLGSYIRGRKLTLSTRLLIESDLSIVDIALISGFGSHEAFSRSFKKQFNLTPSKFRDQNANLSLNYKPFLDEQLLSYLLNTISKEPEIIFTREKTLVGISKKIHSPVISRESYCHLIMPTWLKLFDIQRQVYGTVRRENYGVPKSFQGDFKDIEVDYFVGFEVDQQDIGYFSSAFGLEQLTLPSVKSAAFRVKDIDDSSSRKTIDYVYGYWLPNSAYKRSTGSDYGIFTDLDKSGEESTSAIYVVPIED